MGRRVSEMLLVLLWLVLILLSAGAVCSVNWGLGRALRGRFGAGWVVGEWVQRSPPSTSPLPVTARCGERRLLVLVGAGRPAGAEGLVLGLEGCSPAWVEAQNNTDIFRANLSVCGIALTVYVDRKHYSTHLDQTPQAAGTAVVRSSSAIARVGCCYLRCTPVKGAAGVCGCCRWGKCGGNRRRRSTGFGWNTSGSQLAEGLLKEGEFWIGPLRVLDVADPTPRVRHGGQNASGGEKDAKPANGKTLLTVVGLVAAVALLLAGLAVGGVVLCGALTIFSLYNKLARPSSWLQG